MWVALGCAVGCVAWAHDFSAKNADGVVIFYKVTADGEVEVSEDSDNFLGDTYTGVVKIPQEVAHGGRQYTVTGIGDWAFNKCMWVSEVRMPQTVTRVGHFAFYNCMSLATLTLSDNLTAIGDYAFYGCFSLPSIRIPDGVDMVGERAFYLCSGLKEARMGQNTAGIGEKAFNHCEQLATLWLGPMTQQIGREAFGELTYLRTITCTASTPPEMGLWVFRHAMTTMCTLYVPEESVEAYQQAPQWSAFTVLPLPADGICVPAAERHEVAVYDLQGRKITPEQMRPGVIYIINGRKVKFLPDSEF